MSDPQSSNMDQILQQWKSALGPETFAAAKPGQTLRPRTSFAATEQTAVQMSAPGAPDKPKSTFIPQNTTLAQWNEYTVHGLVDEGGMGEIFRADQGALRRDVAIKKLVPEQFNADAGDKQEAFVSEALVTGFLDHPNPSKAFVFIVNGNTRDPSSYSH